MDFNSLRYFFEAARTGSIRQAAEHVHVAPSAISRQIAKLEHDLGAHLLERRSKGVRLTPAGELLARQLQNTVRDLMRVRGQIDELKGLRRGEVALYCIEGLIDSFLPAVIAQFHARYPEISFKLTVAGTDHIVEALVADEADIGIALNAPSRSELTVVGSWQEPLQAIVAPSHPLSQRDGLTLAELSHYPAALPDTSFGLRRLVDRLHNRLGLEPRILVTTNSILATTCLARQGIAYTLMPPLAVTREKAANTLVTIPLNDPDLELARVEICIHKNRRLPLASCEFLSCLNANLPVQSHRNRRLEWLAARAGVGSPVY